MFFYLSKILAFVVTPLIWIVALLLIAYTTKNQLKRKKCLGAAIIVAILFSTGFVFNEVMRLWEIPAKDDKEISAYEAGIVLGGISMYDESLERIQFLRSSDRLFQAVSLYKRGKIKKIVFSGGSGSISLAHLKEAPIVNKYLIELGIPREDIIYESESRNTFENAKFTAKLPVIEKGKKYLLITSAFHMRRSLACFKKAGIDVVPYSTDKYSGPRIFAFDQLFIPDIEIMFKWDILIHELTGFCVYRIMGYC